MKRILINSNQLDTEILIVDNNRIQDIYFHSQDNSINKNSIYLGKASRFVASLNSIFVNYGEGRDAFVPGKEFAPKYGNPANIKQGQQLIIQIVKDARLSKGPYATTYITLPGCYLVYSPLKEGEHGISRNITLTERERVRSVINSLNITEGKIIARSACNQADPDTIKKDYEQLEATWKNIKALSESKKLGLLHQENSIAIKIVHEYLRSDIEEIVSDNLTLVKDLNNLISSLKLKATKVILHSKRQNIFRAYNVDRDLENLYKRSITLKSGGSLVIEPTEALVSIDINSSKSNQYPNLEETAFNTNLEAVEEIARQIKFRDLSGLIVVDTIDLDKAEHRELVEARFASCLSQDKARIHMSKISPLGLIELSRQCLKSPIQRRTQTCGICLGAGSVMSDRSFITDVFKQVKSFLNKNQPHSEVSVQLPQGIINKIHDSYQSQLDQLKSSGSIVLQANEMFQVPQMLIGCENKIASTPKSHFGLNWLSNLWNFLTQSRVTETAVQPVEDTVKKASKPHKVRLIPAPEVIMTPAKKPENTPAPHADADMPQENTAPKLVVNKRKAYPMRRKSNASKLKEVNTAE